MPCAMLAIVFLFSVLFYMPMNPIRSESFNHEQLLECVKGNLFGVGNAQLPADNMLMVDRIQSISNQGGKYNRGRIVAELDIHPDLWFFQCHFINDPVMPGCLGLDAMWQLLGFFLGWSGKPGRGRALGCGELRFSGQVLPLAKSITYQIDIKRIINHSIVIGIADGSLIRDGEPIYQAKDLKVGLFTSTSD